MLVTIEGMYKDGKIDLAESPQGIDGATAVNLLGGAGIAVTLITKDENIQRSGLVPVLW